MQRRVLKRKQTIKRMKNKEAGRIKKGRSFGLLGRIIMIILCTAYFVPMSLLIFPLKTAKSDANDIPLNIDEPQLVAQAAILVDPATGKILYEKNAREKMFPASTTKMMTALVVYDHMDMNKVLVMPRNYNTHPERFGIRKGDTFTVKELLEIMLVKSANDAAAALAECTAGNVAGFSKLMNEKASELGLVNSHFDNPHGLPDSKHWSCAYDLSRIATELMKNDLFAQIVSEHEVTVAPKASCAQPRTIMSSNKFMTGKGQFYFQGHKISEQWGLIDGIKTGFTYNAGYCLVSSAQIGGERLIAVVLKSDKNNQYSDARKLLEYGFIEERLLPVPQLPRLIVDNSLKKCAPVPTIVDGIVFVPARDYFAALGYKLSWNQARQVLQAASKDHIVHLKQGGSSVFIDGAAYPLGGYGRYIEGKLCIPLQRVSTDLGYVVEHDSSTGDVRLWQAPKSNQQLTTQ